MRGRKEGRREARSGKKLKKERKSKDGNKSELSLQI